MKFNGSFGAWLKQRRKALDLTQQDVAEQVGCAMVTVRKIEAEVSRPSKQIAERLAEVLAVALEDRAVFVSFARHMTAPSSALPLELPAPIGRPDLPPQMTPFIGRGSELAHLAERLSDPHCRLVTLVGPGGIGKTRLVLEAAHDHRGLFAHGVHFVALAPVNSANLLAFAIGSALDFSFYGQEAPAIQLLNYLHEKRLLLILDNFEHLLDGTPLLVDLLLGAPHLKLLITSRERLNLQGEWVLSVEGMDFPRALEHEPLESYPAVQLFVQCARRVQASFSLSQDQAGVQRICQLVEGMPLGLELAAAWVRLLTCTQIAEQLASSLDFLASPMRDTPERHRSLRAVFDHSWGLISVSEQTVFAQLSVFRGSFDLEAANRVAQASLPVLASLLDKSLIRSDGAGHYDLHELLRQYAQDKLEASGETVRTANRHLSYFLSLAKQLEAALKGPQQTVWLDRLELELDNLRAALGWSLASGKAELGLDLAGTLGWFWILRCMSEGWHWLTALLAVNGDARASVRSKALHYAANVDSYSGGGGHTIAFSQQALQLARAVGDKSNSAWALAYLGMVISNIGEYAKGAELLEESLALFRELGDQWGTGHALRRLGYTFLQRDDFEGTATLAEEALALARAAGSKSAIADSLLMLSEVEWYRSTDLRRAVALAQESLSVSREIRSYWIFGSVLCWLGILALKAEDDKTAHAYLEEYLTLAREIRVRPAIFLVLFIAAILSFRQGKLTQAATLLAAAQAHCEDVPGLRKHFDFDRQFAAARTPLDGPEFVAAWAKGRAMVVDQAMLDDLDIHSDNGKFFN